MQFGWGAERDVSATVPYMLSRPEVPGVSASSACRWGA
jgi:hypothetical protein